MEISSISDTVVQRAARRAARAAYLLAAQKGTPVVLWEDGKVVYADPHELLAKNPLEDDIPPVLGPPSGIPL